MGSSLLQAQKLSEWHQKNKNTPAYKKRNKKISNALKGKTNPESGKKLKDWWVKNRHTPKVKKRNKQIVKTRKENNSIWHTDESKQKIGLANKGKPSWSKGLTKKDNLSILAQSKSVKITIQELWNDEQFRKKMLECYPRGEKSASWRGGKSFEIYPREFNNVLKEFIRTRDNHECQTCNKQQSQLTQTLVVHHKDYDKKNCNPKNLITLCKSCHSKTNFNRENWIKYFNGECEAWK